MARRHFRSEEIIAKLREAGVLLGQRMKVDKMRWLKEPGEVSSGLRRAVSDLTLDKMLLVETARGSF